MRKLNKKQKLYIESAVKWIKKGAKFNALDSDDFEALEKYNDYETLYQDANRYYGDLLLKHYYGAK